ncbi:MAG: 50S ribosomal protein L28 [Planctomycetales bacterium]|nr:50S ribosomal protein L28 [Planctomycetales bacterium]MBN8624105.1 50S ribosomal protein L28 [Planctomycetota bacterium]
MARVCNVCGKGPRVGNQVTLRGKAKYLGGVGTKVTGITRRTFKPNLQQVRVTENGTNKTILACTQCIRSGHVTKLVKAKPFRLPTQAGDVKKAAPKTSPKKAEAKKPEAKKAPAAPKTPKK